MEALTNQNPEISAQLSLWSQRGSAVIRGNMTVVPVGTGILYVQPLYLRAENSELPELKRVITSTGGRVVWGETLEESLLRLLGPDGEKPLPPQPASPRLPQGAEGEPRSLQSLAAEAGRYWEEARDALKVSDWEGYGRAMKNLEEVLSRMGSFTEK